MSDSEEQQVTRVQVDFKGQLSRNQQRVLAKEMYEWGKSIGVDGLEIDLQFENFSAHTHVSTPDSACQSCYHQALDQIR